MIDSLLIYITTYKLYNPCYYTHPTFLHVGYTLKIGQKTIVMQMIKCGCLTIELKIFFVFFL